MEAEPLSAGPVRPGPTTRSPSAPGPVASPECPSPTDSEVKRKVPSSMNASWKPLSCPFMVAVVLSDRDAEEGGRGTVRRRPRSAQAEGRVPLGADRRCGANWVAGGAAQGLYTRVSARAPGSAPPLGVARLCTTRAGGGARGPLGLNHPVRLPPGEH